MERNGDAMRHHVPVRRRMMEQEIALLRETELFRDLTGQQIGEILSISRK
jgi:hypothetical protein